MINARRAAILLATFGAGLMSACGPQRVRTPEGAAQDQIVLLPDPESGAIGRAKVSNSTPTATDLVSARDSVLVSANRPPGPVTQMSEADVTRLFGDVLAALPPPPRSFTLYFRFESDELTDESRTLVTQILQTVKARPAPDVVVVGHTDTTGPRVTNYELGLKRANMVRNLLVESGLNPSFISLVSHGEAELLVSTADEIFEPRNRRVEITVR
jgi:OmpA-OmpF porin, OOP family